MFGLSLGHLIVLAIILLLVFGSRRLPDLGSALGKGIFAFKKGLEGKEQDKLDQDNKNQKNNDDHQNKNT